MLKTSGGRSAEDAAMLPLQEAARESVLPQAGTMSKGRQLGKSLRATSEVIGTGDLSGSQLVRGDSQGQHRTVQELTEKRRKCI